MANGGGSLDNMPVVKKIVYLVILLLVLEVVKTIFDKINFTWSFLVSSILGALQLLMVMYFFYELIFKKIIRRKWVLVLSFFIIIAACESFFAYMLYHPSAIPAFFKETVDHYYTHYDRDIIQFNKTLSAYDPKLFYTLKPGVNGTFSNKEFSTSISANQLGLRDDDSSLLAPAIICLGDSYTMGWGVGQQQSFPQVLEKRSGQRVLNAGISSYGTAREMILLKEIDTSNLRHIIIQYCANDFLENNSFVKNNYQLQVSSDTLYNATVRRQGFISAYYPGKYFLLNTKIFLKKQVNKIVPVFNLNEQGEEMNIKEHARIFLDVLLHADINFNKVSITVIALGDTPSFEKGFLQELEQLLLEAPPIDIRLLDLSEAFDKNDCYLIDQHLNDAGHRKVAERLWQAIGSH